MIPAADECFLFRLLVKETATKQGKLATFMGRPSTIAAAGCT